MPNVRAWWSLTDGSEDTMVNPRPPTAMISRSRDYACIRKGLSPRIVSRLGAPDTSSERASRRCRSGVGTGRTLPSPVRTDRMPILSRAPSPAGSRSRDSFGRSRRGRRAESRRGRRGISGSPPVPTRPRASTGSRRTTPRSSGQPPAGARRQTNHACRIPDRAWVGVDTDTPIISSVSTLTTTKYAIQWMCAGAWAPAGSR
jgi:hypothetical protein